MKKICPECGEAFEPVKDTQTECSLTCQLIKNNGGPEIF
jgi:hypothetical protein